MLKVGIIDSGVTLSGIDIPVDRITGVHFYKDEYGCVQSNIDIKDLLGHGTACLATILQYNTDVHFYIVKIFDERWVSDEDILVAAIAECIARQVDIINVSLGIESDQISGPLFHICHEAYSCNIPIIAAGRLDDKICQPACHPEVIGVGSMDMAAPVELVYLENAAVSFYTKGEITFNKQLYFGTSFACAKITGEMLLLMNCLPGYKVSDLKAALIDKAYRARPSYPFKLQYNINFPEDGIPEHFRKKYFDPFSRFLFAKKVLILPLGDADMKSVFTAGPITSGPLQYLYWEHTYYANQIPALIPPDELCNEFDTIALGRLSSLLTFYNCRPIYQQLKLLLKKGKHFIVYEEADYNIIANLKAEANASGEVFLSLLSKEYLDDFRHFDYVPPLKIPVLMVIGAGPHEMLSLQACIRQQFVEMDYDVAYVAPVMQGELTGAVFSYPVQKGRDLYHTEVETGVFLQRMLKAIQFYLNPDFILTGLPDSVVANAAGEEHRPFTASLEFLKGIQPDAFIIGVHENAQTEAVLNNYYTAIGLTGTRKCCFLLIGNRENDALKYLYDFLGSFGIVLFYGKDESSPELERVVRSFFSLQSTHEVV